MQSTHEPSVLKLRAIRSDFKMFQKTSQIILVDAASLSGFVSTHLEIPY